jgi:hypothetical protein
MWLDHHYQIEQAVLNDPKYNRPSLCHVNITTWEKEPVAVASDGFILAVVPVFLDEGDVLGLVQANAFKIARKSKIKPPRLFLREQHVEFPDGTTIPRFTAEHLEYPNISVVFHDTKPYPVLAMNTEYLRRLSKALGSDRLYFYPERTTGVLVSPNQTDKLIPPFGITTPIKTATE